MIRHLKVPGVLGLAVLIPVTLLAGAKSEPGLSAPASHLKRITPERRLGHKPEAPVRIELLPGPMLPNGTQQARIVVTPLVDAEALEVTASGDEGLGVLRGESGWRGAARRRQPVQRDVILGAAPAPSGRRSRRLIVTAQMSFPLAPGETEAERRLEVAVAAWAINPRALRLEEAHPGARVVRTRQGRRILEIPGE